MQLKHALRQSQHSVSSILQVIKLRARLCNYYRSEQQIAIVKYPPEKFGQDLALETYQIPK